MGVRAAGGLGPMRGGVGGEASVETQISKVMTQIHPGSGPAQAADRLAAGTEDRVTHRRPGMSILAAAADSQPFACI